MTTRYRLPIRTWEALNDTVLDLNTRLSRVEGKTAAMLAMLAIITALNIAILSLALRP